MVVANRMRLRRLHKPRQRAERWPGQRNERDPGDVPLDSPHCEIYSGHLLAARTPRTENINAAPIWNRLGTRFTWQTASH
jgi:hypothetical protein